MNQDITCPHCQVQFVISTYPHENQNIHFCPFCRKRLKPEVATKITDDTLEAQSESAITTISFIQEHLPDPGQILFTLGQYQVLQSIGKGGMGEVFLAYDTTCGRRLALKQIRPDLHTHKQLHNRFLKEARITSQLTHPAIIPIYTIHDQEDRAFYTMPYIQGRTLKQLLRTARQQEQKGEKMDHIAESIPALLRIFLSICQAIAYAHSKNVLHRDLKPENIIVGHYGQIVILDWGLAKLIDESVHYPQDGWRERDKKEKRTEPHATHVGKVVGTVSYMAPERAMGYPANFQTDIYSLGVILYQLLTLRMPFHRESLKEFRKKIQRERLTDPIEVAPYRDIQRSLSLVVKKCLSPNPEQRYQTVDALIHDLENYLEGRAEWFKIASLDILNKEHWEFQENVFIAEHIALTSGTDMTDWYNLMISKDSFQESLKIEAEIKIGEENHGVGFLLNIPETAERQHLNDGYCLWLGTESNRSTKLLRSTVEVLSSSDTYIKPGFWHQIRIEKRDNNLHVYLNNVLQFTYISYLPLTGTHVGVILRDADLEIRNFFVFVGSQNVMVNCLAVPDAFLAHKDYTTALNEYRRIAYSFPGRSEGREAMFRAGITLLEEATIISDAEQKAVLLDSAAEEFHKLHNTPGAPLEYLGKSLIYKAMGDYEEESKCFELAYRRYPRHPLLPILEEQIIYRTHESSRYNRQATFNFLLLAIKFLPDVSTKTKTLKLLTSLDRHWEPFPFVEEDQAIALSSHSLFIFAIKLAFWLERSYSLSETIDGLAKLSMCYPITICNALFCLVKLGAWKLAAAKLCELEKHGDLAKSDAFKIRFQLLKIDLECDSNSPEEAANQLAAFKPRTSSLPHERTLIHVMEFCLDRKKIDVVEFLGNVAKDWPLTTEGRILIDGCKIWGLLLGNRWDEAGQLLHAYPYEFLNQETSILHFLYGCWLDVTEGKEIASIHFSGILEMTYPRSWNLFSHYLKKDDSTAKQNWPAKLFLWERRKLYRQLSLFAHCNGEESVSGQWGREVLKEFVNPDPL